MLPHLTPPADDRQHSGATEHGRESILHPDERQPDTDAGLERGHHVNVTLRPDIVPDHGTERCQASDVVTFAELGCGRSIGRQV
jgi:hypothetical protein